MLFHVMRLEDAYPNRNWAEPDLRAASLAYAGRDYFIVTSFVRENHMHIGPVSTFLLPAMHQTLELLSKAIAFKVDPTFNPRKFSHKTIQILEKYKKTAQIFASILSNPDSFILIDNLEKAYLGVRYAECATTMDGEAWDHYVNCSVELLDDLHVRTGLGFLTKHFPLQSNPISS